MSGRAETRDAYYTDAEWAALMDEWREEQWRETLIRTGRNPANPRLWSRSGGTASERAAAGPDPAEAAQVGACRRCGREILWAISERGNWTPLDPEPTPVGTFALGRGVAFYVADGDLFRFHGLSCPVRAGRE